MALPNSGTFNTTNYDTRTIVDRAYGALKLTPQQVTSEKIQIALDTLSLVLSDLIATQAPLWTIQKVLITLNQGQKQYILPSGTVDVDQAFYRTMNNVTPAAISSSPTAYSFDFGLTPQGVDNVTHVFSMSITWTGAAVPVTFQSSADGVTWDNVYTSNLTQLATGTIWYDMDVTNARRYWQIIPTPATPVNTLGITSARVYNTPADIEMYRMNKDQYWNMTNKGFQGRPLQFWLDRQLNPAMDLWPQPDHMASQNLMAVWRHRYIMDVGSLQQALELPARWYWTIVYALAEALSWCTPEVDPQVTSMIGQKADMMLRKAWSEERDKSNVVYNVGLRVYTR